MLTRWNFRKLAKSNFVEYFYYFFIVAFVIILALSGPLYFIYTSAMEDEIIHSNNTILEQIKNAQETILSAVENSVANIAMDSYITNFEDIYYSRDILMTKTVIDRLNSYTLKDSYINSISVCFLESGWTLSSDEGFVNTEMHYDSAFLKSLNTSANLKRNIIIRDMPKNNDTQKVKVITLLNPIPLNPVSAPRAAILVNIDSNYLQTTLNSIDIRDNSSIVITDQTGNVVTEKNGSKTFGTDISKYVDFKAVTQNNYEIRNVNGSKYLISSIMSSSYGLRYIYIVPMSTITSKLQVLGKVTLFICLGILFMSLLISIILSKKIYSPISSILSFLNENIVLDKNNTNSISVKETKVIENSISNLVDSNKNLTKKNKDLETVLAEYNLYQRNKFLQDIICGERDIDDTVSGKLGYYGIDIDIDGYIVLILLSIDNYTQYCKEYSEKQRNMLDIYINENITTSILSQCKGLISELRDNEKAVLLNFKDDLSIEDIQYKLSNYTRKIAELAGINSKYSFTLGVSKLHKGLKGLHNCYSESHYALNYRLILGYSHIIHYEDINVHNDFTVLYPFHIEKDILNNLKLGDEKGIIDSLNKFNSYFYNNPVENIETVRHYFLQLLSASLKTLYEIDRSIYSSILSDKNIYVSFIAEETIQGMSAYIKKLFESVLLYISKQKDEKNKEFINSLIQYIRDNLHSDLSVDRLAEHYFMSTSYFRKIFKDEIGEPIKEYIDKERMKKAKELLENPHIKIRDVAAKIGYISVTSFTRAFKQESGKTPGEYRDDILMKS